MRLAGPACALMLLVVCFSEIGGQRRKSFSFFNGRKDQKSRQIDTLKVKEDSSSANGDEVKRHDNDDTKKYQLEAVEMGYSPDLESSFNDQSYSFDHNSGIPEL